METRSSETSVDFRPSARGCVQKDKIIRSLPRQSGFCQGGGYEKFYFLGCNAV
jgi:hypothetical protein